MNDHIDEFESIFKRAERELFVFANIPIDSVTIITDQNQDSANASHWQKELIRFLPRLEPVHHWRTISGDQYSNVAELLEKVDEEQTDLIVTWRHLQEESLVPQHSLGVYLDVLTQITSIPVIVLPGTAIEPRLDSDRVCDKVMVVADHISGDNRLINYGIRLCRNGGKTWLCHIEDDRVFQRYMQAIERIPEIASEDARALIHDQLLKQATDFIESCVTEINAVGPNVALDSVVSFGHYLREYRDLINENDIDMIVTNTKDDDQLAMHGIAYSLSVEMVDVTMLLL